MTAPTDLPVSAPERFSWDPSLAVRRAEQVLVRRAKNDADESADAVAVSLAARMLRGRL